jgi:hypothetical protein
MWDRKRPLSVLTSLLQCGQASGVWSNHFVKTCPCIFIGNAPNNVRASNWLARDEPRHALETSAHVSAVILRSYNTERPVVGSMLRGQQHAVTDGRDDKPAGESVDDESVEGVAVDITAHPAGAVAAGQQ